MEPLASKKDLILEPSGQTKNICITKWELFIQAVNPDDRVPNSLDLGIPLVNNNKVGWGSVSPVRAREFAEEPWLMFLLQVSDGRGMTLISQGWRQRSWLQEIPQLMRWRYANYMSDAGMCGMSGGLLRYQPCPPPQEVHKCKELQFYRHL